MIFNINGVWRSGSAPVLGTGGRRFDPGHPDHFFSYEIAVLWSLVKTLKFQTRNYGGNRS
jgi:hypothetical protein